MAPPASTAAVRAPWAVRRAVAGAGLLAALVWWLGTGPFLAGLRLIDAPALAAALVIGLVTTVCCGWRWALVAGGLGVRLPIGTAVAHCYRAVFLNSTLPGGVLGDVHRAVRHGRDAGDVSSGIRAVVWERTAGQVVQLVVALVVLLALPSPVRRYLPTVVAVLLAAVLGLALLAWAAPRSGPSRWARARRTAAADVRAALLGRRT
ncbi:MAG: lysylphosphatidylglycerol synthase domain-containing protein, partial [Micromonospora sp.]